ncbi:MAG: hypothetical protein MJA83_03680 [Gammaproteobacteria bacterium]|nr:hypothetical protein [Gammaproteobacteria bacterium]
MDIKKINLATLKQAWARLPVKRLLPLLIITIVFVLNMEGKVSDALNTYGLETIEIADSAYLEQAKKEVTELLILFSRLKAGVAIVKSSGGGISFIVDVNVTLGEVLSPIDDLINNGWIASQISLAALSAADKLLELSKIGSSILLDIALVVLALHILLRLITPKINLGEAASFAIAMWLLLQFILPLAVYSNIYLQQHISSPNRAELQIHIQTKHQDLMIDLAHLDMHAKVKGAIERYKLLSHHGDDTVKSLAKNISHHMATVFLEAFLIPLAFIVLAYLFTKYLCAAVLTGINTFNTRSLNKNVGG